MGELDDFGELYADLEDRVIAGVLAEAEVEYKANINEHGAAFENATVDSVRCTDSEDDLHIVLNEGDYQSKLPAEILSEGRHSEDDDIDDLIIITGSNFSGKEPTWAVPGHSADESLRGNGARENATNKGLKNWSRHCLAESAVCAQSTFRESGYWNNLAMPHFLANTSYNSSFHPAFPNGQDFYLLRNKSIFDIDVESFECKPWRFNGADITNYFNFGLDEQGWKTYCNQLAQFCQNKLSLHESPNKPKGQAIQVESGNGNRIPSMDIRRPRNRDSDVVIQICTAIDRETPVDENGSKSELFVNCKNELCKSSFSSGYCFLNWGVNINYNECFHSYMKKPFDPKHNMNCGGGCPSRDMSLSKYAVTDDHSSKKSKPFDYNGSLKASENEVCLEKAPSLQCIPLNSDSLLEGHNFSHCCSSSETGSDTNKKQCTASRGNFHDSFLHVNYCQQTTPCKSIESDLSSDDGVAFLHEHIEKNDGEHLTKNGKTVVRHWYNEPYERGHSNQRSKISLKNNAYYNGGYKANAAFIVHTDGHDEDLSPVRKKDKRNAAREVSTRRNGCYINRSSQHYSRFPDMVNTNYLQLSSGNMFCYSERGCHTSRRVIEHDMIMKSHYNAVEAKDQHRERTLDEYRKRYLNKYYGNCAPYFKKQGENSNDKHDKVSCSAGELRRLQESHRHGKTLHVNSEMSHKYPYNHEGSWLCKGGFHPRIHGEVYDEDKSSWLEDDFQKSQLLSVSKHDKRCTSHIEHTHTRVLKPLNKHGIVFNKRCHPFSRSGFNFDDGHFSTEVRTPYTNVIAYNESTKRSLALPELLAKKERNITHQDSFSHKLYCPNIVHTQNGPVDNNSFIRHTNFDNHHNNSGNKLSARSCKGSDSGDIVGHSKNYDKNKIYLDDIRTTARKHLNAWKVKTKEGSCISSSSSSRSHCSTDSAAFKESMNFDHIEETEELEEGQLVEGSNIHETADAKRKSDEINPALIPGASNPVTDPTDPRPKEQLYGRYNKNHLLETLAKMEKRQERFKNPIILKKATEHCGRPAADIEKVKQQQQQQRPARKRLWSDT